MLIPSRSFLWFMRPWPLVAASGASGGAFGFLVQVLRELSSGSPVLIPPEPELPVLSSGLDFSLESWWGHIHPPSLVFGILLGICLGPVLDFCVLLRLGLLRSWGRISRPAFRLYRILE